MLSHCKKMQFFGFYPFIIYSEVPIIVCEFFWWFNHFFWRIGAIFIKYAISQTSDVKKRNKASIDVMQLSVSQHTARASSSPISPPRSHQPEWSPFFTHMQILNFFWNNKVVAGRRYNNSCLINFSFESHFIPHI
jgi:hypothetical protein